MNAFVQAASALGAHFSEHTKCVAAAAAAATTTKAPELRHLERTVHELSGELARKKELLVQQQALLVQWSNRLLALQANAAAARGVEAAGAAASNNLVAPPLTGAHD